MLFWRSFPKFEGWNLHPPNLGGMGFQGMRAKRFVTVPLQPYFGFHWDTFWRFLTFFTWPLSAGPFCNPLTLESVEHGRIHRCFPRSGGSLCALGSLENGGIFEKTPFLSAPNHKSQIASDSKPRSPNRKNSLQIAVSARSNRTFKSRDLWFEALFKSPLESQCRSQKTSLPEPDSTWGQSTKWTLQKKLHESTYSRPDNYYIINSSEVQKCNVIFYYFLHGRRM